jgi:hypothetical protein
LSEQEEYYKYLNSPAYRRETALRQAESTVSRARGYQTGVIREPDVEANKVLEVAEIYENYLNKGASK